MAVDEERIKAVASWGFLGAPGGESETQILEEPMDITLAADTIAVEIDEG